MKKHILPRAVIGFASGVTIGIGVILCISLALGQNEVLLVTPAFLTLCGGNELLAFSLENLLMGLIGLAFAEASISFTMESWSFGRQYLVFCLSSAAVWIPICLLCWFPKNLEGLGSIISSFAATYLINWLIQLGISRRNVRRMNEKLREEGSRT